jgi:predicted nucleic acid-binding protein
MLVVDTNVLIELFLPSGKAKAVQPWRVVDEDWRFPSLWLFEFRQVHLYDLRAGLLGLDAALENLSAAERLFLSSTVSVDSAKALQLAHHSGCSSYDAEFVVIAQQLHCPLLTFDHKLLQLFPDLAMKPGS